MKTYPMTQAGFDALRTRLLAAGVTIPTDYGNLTFQGITLKYSFNGEFLGLSIQRKPFLIPSAMIWGQVDKWIAA